MANNDPTPPNLFAHENRLVTIDSTPRDWHGIKHYARFVLDGQTFLPSLSDKHHSLMVSVQGFALDPRLQFSVLETKHPVMIEFRGGKISDLHHRVDESGKGNVLEIVFKSKGAIGIGISNNDGDELLQKLRHHMRTMSKPERIVRFRVCLKKTTEHTDFISSLQSLSTFSSLPWHPYIGARSGFPITHFSQMRPHDTLKKFYKPHKIMKIPASNHFYDITEAAVKLAYGARLEYEESLIHLNRVGGVEHTITIFEVSGSKILLGAVEFGNLEEGCSPEDLVDTPVVIPDGSTCEISLRKPVTRALVKFDAVSIPKLITMPVKCDLLLQMSPSAMDSSSVVNPLNSCDTDPMEKFTCTLEFELHTNFAEMQVAAINNFCFDTNTRWHPVLLNQDYMSLGTVDVFDGIPEMQIRDVYERIYSVIDFDAAQKQVFELLRRVPGNGWAFIEGTFGCGKTLVQAALAKLLTDLGFHVLMVAPTSAAVEAISKTIFEKMPELNTVKVSFAGPEDGNQFPEGVGQSSSDSLMLRRVHNTLALRQSQHDPIHEHALETHVSNLVAAFRERGRILLFKYRARLSNSPLFNPDHDEPSDDERYDDDDRTEYDAVEIYTKFQSTDFSSPKSQSSKEREEWTTNRQVFGKALSILREDVIATTKLLLCTQNLVSLELIRHHLASRDCKGIVVIGDEDGQSSEPVQLIPLTLLQHADKVTANLCFGDTKQLPPRNTLSGSSKYNEFGAQLQRSLFDRSLRYHPPAVALNVQYRMHPTLSEFLSDFMYGSQLLNGEGCENFVDDGVFSRRLIDWATPYLLSKPGDNFSRLLGVNVPDAEVEINNATCSRSNPKVASVVSQMLHTIYRAAPYPTSAITIITPYNAQRVVYLDIIRRLHEKTKLPFNMLPKVATIEAMQGHESAIVILDWVNTYGGELGFLKDDRRANVALSRARACLIVFFSVSQKEERNTKKAKKGKGKEKCAVLCHWDYLVRKGLDMEVRRVEDSAFLKS